MTIPQILKTVGERRTISRKQFYRIIKVCKIKPAGLRQRPQQYPDDTPIRILVRLGFPRVVTLRTLKAVRKQAANGRRTR